MTFSNERIQLKLGNCLDVLKDFPDGCIDAVVTDPPYGLSFMGKKWDYDVPNKEIWAECLRVLKPGGNLLCFAGTRTQHRMVARVVESGFVMQDAVLWAYGSGFPKSHSISKAIDKLYGVKGEVVGQNMDLLRRNPNGVSGSMRLDGFSTVAELEAAASVGGKCPNGRDAVKTLSRLRKDNYADIVAPSTDAAKQWEGWGTSMKPSFEPVSIYTKGDSLTLHSEFKRLYYCAKASKKERNLGLGDRVSNHPTVKPLKLMEQLCQLATPKGGVILDPFMGSGTTGIAALNLGFNFVGIEMGEEYFDIAQTRIVSLHGDPQQ